MSNDNKTSFHNSKSISNPYPNSEAPLGKEPLAEPLAQCDINRLLFEKQFTEIELEGFVHKVSMRRILKSQKSISREFIKKYILEPKYHKDDADEYLTWEDVYFYRPELNNESYSLAPLEKASGST